MKAVHYIHNKLLKKKEFLVYKMIKKHKLNLTYLHTLKYKIFIMLFKEWKGSKLNVKS